MAGLLIVALALIAAWWLWRHRSVPEEDWGPTDLGPALRHLARRGQGVGADLWLWRPRLGTRTVRRLPRSSAPSRSAAPSPQTASTPARNKPAAPTSETASTLAP